MHGNILNDAVSGNLPAKAFVKFSTANHIKLTSYGQNIWAEHNGLLLLCICLFYFLMALILSLN